MNGHLCLSGILVYPAVLESLIPAAKTALPHTPGKPGHRQTPACSVYSEKLSKTLPAGRPSKNRVKSPADAWLLEVFVDKYSGRDGVKNASKNCVHCTDAKGAG